MVNWPINPVTFSSSDGLDQAEDTKEEDMEDKDGASHRPKNSPASPHPPEENNNSNDQKGGASVPLSSEMERHDNSEGKEEESRAEDLTAKESGHHVREMLPSSADHNREMLPSSADHNTDDDQNQQLPTASIGSDLIQEAEVSERSFPKSKKRLSMPSTPQAQAKQGRMTFLLYLIYSFGHLKRIAKKILKTLDVYYVFEFLLSPGPFQSMYFQSILCNYIKYSLLLK